MINFNIINLTYNTSFIFQGNFKKFKYPTQNINVNGKTKYLLSS